MILISAWSNPLKTGYFYTLKSLRKNKYRECLTCLNAKNGDDYCCQLPVLILLIQKAGILSIVIFFY